MKRKYSLALGLLLLISITYLCTSYIPFPFEVKGKQLESGSYDLKVQGRETMKLLGTASYASVPAVSDKGRNTQKFQLRLVGENKKETHSITIYFTGLESSDPLKKGTYYITQNISGFLNNFEGVFGFADIHLYGELPFFAKRGTIQISNSDERNLEGRLDLELKNNAGEVVEVSGDFAAMTAPEKR